MEKVKVLIVEDEALVASDISLRLASKGYEVDAIAASAVQAMEILKTSKPDICLLDIKIKGDVDGIELAQLINKVLKIPIIFLTSMADQETIEKAKTAQPAAYILKPFNDRELQIAIDLAISNYERGKIARSFSEDSTVNEHDVFCLNESIFMRKKERFERVHFMDILWAKAESNYTEVKTRKDKFTISNTLQVVGEKLSAPYFVRIHRSHLVNLMHVESLEGNRIYINGRQFTVSQSYRVDVFQRFNFI